MEIRVYLYLGRSQPFTEDVSYVKSCLIGWDRSKGVNQWEKMLHTYLILSLAKTAPKWSRIGEIYASPVFIKHDLLDPWIMAELWKALLPGSVAYNIAVSVSQLSREANFPT